MTTLRADCFKFSPNIFIQTKCQNCFRTKEVHSADALENCKVTRKVLKCGYLFVAPDWDFSLYINRNKRWQRRWFVLYDDGELTYSVDEYPDTIPQAVIDMNKVLEVSDAEDITGNQYSIAITANEKVHFVKGTSKEEKKWWFDVLSRFPKFTIRSNKPNRNTTFSVGKMTSKIDEVIRNNKNSRNGIYKTYDSSKEIKNNTHDIYWKDYQKHSSNDDVFHNTEYRAPKKDVIIQLKPTNPTETNASFASPVNSNTLIQKSNLKAPIILNKCNINVDNCDNKKLNTSCDASRMRTSIAELESISVQACQLTNELVCCRKELIELRRKIKDKDDNNVILMPNDVIISEPINVDLFKKRELSVTTTDPIDSQPKQSKQTEIETIRKLKLELKEAQSNYDYLEIAYERLTKKISEMEKLHESELNLMNDRINDLTCKLISSERLLRLAKQKIAKHEARQERRRSSLKGKN